jgi:NADPH-dependent 2,4-dienoyl-CoA reductase/sulfur reductase-like enzyme
MVAGGGVAGLYAAATAALRGHEVTLFEATETLGGQMRLAAYPPGKGDITNMVRSYIHKCEQAGVNICLNTPVTAEMLENESFDAAIIATGAKPLVLPIPGIETAGLIHAIDLLDGKAACGQKVLVVGGGMVGSETAAFLGHDVTVIELREDVAADVISEHRLFLMKDFDEYQIKSIVNAKVTQFFEGGVVYTLTDAPEQELKGFDTVVLAMGAKAYDPLSEAVKKVIKEIYLIGDAVQARRALEATAEALEAALSV